MQTTQSKIELFHLLFLRFLENRIDKNLYALKGGCNLRFFFKSIRYSEDIDLDVRTIAVITLKNKVDKILGGVDFQKILQSKNITIAQFKAVKQTETTQRWKLMLRSPNLSLPFPTKIEFSRRNMDSGILYEGIDNELITHHQIYPILCNHYDRYTAFTQKINALIHRTETQARDVFDLKWLLDQGVNIKNTQSFTQEKISIAIKNTEEIQYEDFKGQVVAYLMDSYQQYYDSQEKWHEIKTQVITALHLVNR